MVRKSLAFIHSIIYCNPVNGSLGLGNDGGFGEEGDGEDFDIVDSGN